MLEHYYGSLALTGLLLGHPMLGLGDEYAVTAVEMQQSGTSPVDDLVVTGEAADSKCTIRIACRRRPTIGKSNQPTVELFAKYLVAIEAERLGYESGDLRLGLAVAGPQGPAAGLAQLTDVARLQPGSTEFSDAVNAPRAYTAAVRTRLTNVMEVVEAALSALGRDTDSQSVKDETWTLLKSLFVLQEDLEGDVAAGVTAMVGTLQGLVGTAERAQALRHQLVDLASLVDIRAGSMTRAMLRKALRPFGQIGASEDFTAARSQLQLLEDSLRRRTDGSLPRLGGGEPVRIDRQQSQTALVTEVESLPDGGVLIVRGEPDVGKSVLALNAMDSIRADGGSIVVLSLRDVPPEPLTFRMMVGLAPTDLLSGAPSGPKSVLLIDGAEVMQERDDRILPLLLKGAASAGMPIVLITRDDAAGYLIETIGRCGLETPRELVVSALSDDEFLSLRKSMPEIAPLANDERVVWLLRRPGILELILRVAIRERRLPSAVLSEADVARIVWASLVRDDERVQNGISPDDLDAAALAVARGLLTGSQPQVAGGALARLRSEGVLLPRTSTSAWRCTDAFASDVLRDFAAATLLTREGLGVLEATSGPRWTIRAARIYAQDRLGQAVGQGDTAMLQSWRDLRAEFGELGATHGARWREVPWEALLSAGWADQALSAMTPDLVIDEALMVEALRTVKLRFSSAGACDPAIGGPLLTWLLANYDLAGMFNSYQDDQFREFVLSWLTGVARREAQGGDVDVLRASRVAVRDLLLSLEPSYRSQGEWLECLGLLGSESNESSRTALRIFAQEKSHSLATLVESIDVALSMSVEDVGLLCELAEAYYIEEPKHSAWGTIYLDDGIRHHRPGGWLEPHSAWYLGPFHLILRADFGRGLALIDRMLDQGARKRVEILKDLSSRHEERTFDEAETQGLELDLWGLGARWYVGDAHVWNWYRGSLVGPSPCMSALLALEATMDALVQAGIAVRQVAVRVLGSATTLASVGLIHGFLVRHLDQITDELDDFLSVPEIWNLEIGRVTSEVGFSIRRVDSGELVGREMRSWTPQVVCMQLVSRAMSAEDSAVLNRLRAIGVELLEAAGGDAASPYVKQWVATLDSTAYSFTPADGGVLVEVNLGEETKLALAKDQEHSAPVLEMYRLQNRYRLREVTPYLLDFAEVPSASDLAADYAAARRLQSELIDEPLDQARPALAGVAGMLLLAASQGSTVPEGGVVWAEQVLVDSAMSPYTGHLPNEDSIIPDGSDRAAAFALPLALLPPVLLGSESCLSRSDVVKVLVAGAISGSAEVRRNATQGLGRLLGSQCATDGTPCSIHTPVWEAIEAGARRVTMGPWNSSGRREIEVISGDLPTALATIKGDDLVPSRLLSVIVTALDAGGSRTCTVGLAMGLLPALLDAYGCAVVEWSQHDYAGRHEWRPALASALLRQDAQDGGSRVLEMAKSLAPSAPALASFLNDLQVVATFEAHSVKRLAVIWPALMQLGFERLREESDGSERHGREDLLKELIPSPSPSWFVGDFSETLDAARSHWFGMDAVTDHISEWCAQAAGGMGCVDQLVGFLQAQAMQDQAAPGLSWVRLLIVKEDGSASTCGFLLVEWLTALRDSEAIDSQSLGDYRATVDALVLSNYSKARNLQSRDE